ncbi:MAG: hypothetical protein ABSE73_01475 [Planctomycetota bacterium]
MKTAFHYGEYERLAKDPRTQRILKAVERVARKLSVKYALVGGLATYLHTGKPPEDYPGIDILLYAPVAAADEFFKRLAGEPDFHFGSWEVTDDASAVFATFFYDGAIQVDVFNAGNVARPRRTRRMMRAGLWPVEPLIVGYVISGTHDDLRMVLDLLAYTDFDRRLLFQIGWERGIVQKLAKADRFAWQMGLGKLTKRRIETWVRNRASLGTIAIPELWSSKAILRFMAHSPGRKHEIALLAKRLATMAKKHKLPW